MDEPPRTLKQLGVADILLLRPATSSRAVGVPEIDQIHITCDGLSPPVPLHEVGILTLHAADSAPFNAKFIQTVTPRTTTDLTNGDGGVFLCTRSIYTFTFSSQAVITFLKHYLEVWQFDKVLLYEMGTSGGKLLQDMLLEYADVLPHADKIELVDLRDELQRQYGPIAGDIVFFSREVGSDVQAADCMARAKQAGAAWVMHVDWEDLLTVGGETAAVISQPTIQQLLQRHTTSTTSMLKLQSLKASDSSACEYCNQPQYIWDQIKARTHHIQHEFPANAWESNKYLIRVQDVEDWGYASRAFASCAMLRGSTRLVPSSEYYVRQYSCFGSEMQCPDARPVMNWALDFGGRSQLPDHLKAEPTQSEL